MRLVVFSIAMMTVFTPAAQAAMCRFDTECFEAEACADSSFAAEMDIAAQTIETDFGTLAIADTRAEPGLVSVIASGDGARYMLTITKDGARMTAHLHDGPLVVSYLGQCEGIF